MPRNARSARPRLLLESLEDRVTPATVTSVLDDGSPGTLRAVIAAAAPGEEINLGPALNGATIVLNGTPLTIDKDVSVRDTAGRAVTISGGGLSRIFDVVSAPTPVGLYLSGVTLSGGNAAGGGAIRSDGGVVTLNSVLVSDSTSTGPGGAISITGGSLTLDNTTVSDNLATDDGGGIFADGGTVLVRNSTIAGNRSGTDGTGQGGGLFIDGSAAVTLSNSLLGDNVAPAPADGPDVFRSSGTLDAAYSLIEDAPPGAITGSGAGVLTGIDADLGPLQFNGGNVWSRALRPGSPAIDAGDPSVTSQGTDTRDGQFQRVVGGQIDIGAFEAQRVATNENFGYSSSDPQLYVRIAGEPVTYYLTAHPQDRAPFPTGTTTFIDQDTGLELGTDSTGQAFGDQTLLYSLAVVLPVGHHSVVARYNGDDLTAPFLSPIAIDTFVAPSLPFSASGVADGTATRFGQSAPGADDAVPIVTVRPFGNIPASVRSATADVDGDRIPDTIFVTGPGTQFRVAVVSGADNTTLLVAPFAPFEPTFDAGGFVAAGDFDGDGRAEFVITPDRGGGPRVSIYDLTPVGELARVANFFAFESEFHGGARAAVGDVNADGTPDLVLAAGFGGGPRVAVLDGARLFAPGESGEAARLVPDFFAFDPDLRDGAFVAAGDFDGDGHADLVFGAGNGGSPRVLVVGGAQLLSAGAAAALGAPLGSFFVGGDETNRGGVRVAVIDVDGDQLPDLAAASGIDRPGGVVVYRGARFPGGEPGNVLDIDPFHSTLPGGAFVG